MITRTLASPWAGRAISDPLLFTTQATDPAGLIKAIEDARKKIGGLPLDEKVATAYALRATDLLQKLAINRGQVFDLSAAEPPLLASLNDKRPEVVKAVADVLALMDFKEVQSFILVRAEDDKTPDEVKIGLYKSLATSARFFGNRLGDDEVASLQKVVDGSGTNEVRTAAAECRRPQPSGGPRQTVDRESERLVGTNQAGGIDFLESRLTRKRLRACHFVSPNSLMAAYHFLLHP